MTEIEDLEAPHNPPVAPLCIKVKDKNLLPAILLENAIMSSPFNVVGSYCINQDPRDYFDSQQANAIKILGEDPLGTAKRKSAVKLSEAFGSLRECISQVKSAGLHDPIVKSKDALQVIVLFRKSSFNIPSYHDDLSWY